jgi:hypothetical protein
MKKHPLQLRFEQAMRLGPLAMLRVRAEVLLEGDYPLTDAEREEISRIAVAPKESDGEYLGRFDCSFEEEEDE